MSFLEMAAIALQHYHTNQYNFLAIATWNVQFLKNNLQWLGKVPAGIETNFIWNTCEGHIQNNQKWWIEKTKLRYFETIIKNKKC